MLNECHAKDAFVELTKESRYAIIADMQILLTRRAGISPVVFSRTAGNSGRLAVLSLAEPSTAQDFRGERDLNG
jgi:hypothetical protein